jgi:hypothetical protein
LKSSKKVEKEKAKHLANSKRKHPRTGSFLTSRWGIIIISLSFLGFHKKFVHRKQLTSVIIVQVLIFHHTVVKDKRISSYAFYFILPMFFFSSLKFRFSCKKSYVQLINLIFGWMEFEISFVKETHLKFGSKSSLVGSQVLDCLHLQWSWPKQLLSW